MDSTLLLQYGALPTTTLCIPSTLSVRARVPIRPHSSFNPSSFSLSSNVSTRRAPPGHAFSPVICDLNRWSTTSTSNKDGNKIVRGMGGASVVLSCVLGIINCSYKFCPRAIAILSTETEQDQISGSLHPKSAKDVLHSLLMVNEHVASAERKYFTPDLKCSPDPSMEECEKLKTDAAVLIKSGKGDKAVEQLRDIYNTMKGKKGESAYNVQMVLVAILIFQGKYIEASKCECLTPQFAIPSDDRVHLYKAIIHTMLDENKEAKDCWGKFLGCLDNDLPGSFPSYSDVTSSSSKSKHVHHRYR